MKPRFFALLASAAALWMTSCGSEPLVLASGVRLEIDEPGTETRAAEGQFLALHYEARTSDGTLVDSSRSRQEPLVAQLGEESLLIEGLREGLTHLGAGGKAVIHIPAEHAYAHHGKGSLIPPDTDLHYDVEVLEFFEVRESGLQIRVVEPGQGPPPTDGDVVVLHYTGVLPRSGREVQTSRKLGRPEEFVLGQTPLVPAFDEAIRIMSPGSRSQIIVPPELGFGLAGHPPAVPPKATLLYDLHLVGIRQNR